MQSVRRTGFDVNVSRGASAFREAGFMAAVASAAMLVALSALVA